MEFEKFDFFIIVSCDRFRENDAKLAKEIQKMTKKFYFVRSKVDHNIRDEKEEDLNSKEEEVLKTVRNYYTAGKVFILNLTVTLFNLMLLTELYFDAELQKLGFKSPKDFLVSGLKLHLYEFKDLWKTLLKELPEHLRDVLVPVLPNISLEAIEQKKIFVEQNNMALRGCGSDHDNRIYNTLHDFSGSHSTVTVSVVFLLMILRLRYNQILLELQLPQVLC